MGIVALTIATRTPSLFQQQPIDDEAVYSVVANEIVDGGRPYIDAVERKPPLLFWTYAAIFEVFGEYDWAALHAVALLWTLGTMGGLYVIGRRLFDPATGLIAALFYSIFQCWATGNNLAFNGELMMNLPLVWAWAIAFGKGSSRNRPELLAAGALLCTAFLFKQPAAIAAVPIGVYLLLPDYRERHQLNLSGSLLHAAMLTAGFVATLGLVSLVLWHQGILGEAFYWTIANHTVPHVFWESAGLFTLAFAACCLPLLLGAFISRRTTDEIWGNKRVEGKTLLYLVFVSIIGIAVGGRFYPHYYIQVVLPLALLAAPYFAQLWSGKIQPPHLLLRPKITWAWLGTIVIAFAISHWQFLRSETPLSAPGRYVLEHSAAGDRIFVWGKRPKIYLQAGRRPACRYVETFPLTGSIFGGPLPGVDTRDRIVPGSWQHLQEDFARHPPAFIIDCYSEPDAPYPIRDFPILANLLAEKYRVAKRLATATIYQMR